ncbi:uncharacterized protein EV154DRAFT_389809, partial [Mucor mucedo]|uniref:uncharacterized protein n=1 Tax=Mucor mucedo TaxID=29922 RepID=UPI00221F6B18
ELSLLKISGGIEEESQGRLTKDHGKAGFGILSMLQRIGYMFPYGSLETFSTMLLYFVQVLGE